MFTMIQITQSLIADKTMPQVDVQKYDLTGASCDQRIKAGAMLGFVVGLTIGGVFGGSAVFR